VLYEMKDCWPFGAALRRASNRLMPRWLKTVVVSDEEGARDASDAGRKDDHR